METKEEERWAVKLKDGSFYPGFNSQVEAEQAIVDHLDWQGKGAKAVKLLGQIKSD